MKARKSRGAPGTSRAAVVTAGDPNNADGGAERFNRAMLRALSEQSVKAAAVVVPHREGSVEEILKNYEVASATDVSDFDFVLSSKVPTYAVRHPQHAVFLNHTVRVFDDMFEERFPEKWEELLLQRKAVHDADFDALRHTTAIICQGHEVAERLWRYRGLPSAVMHPPMELTNFKQGPAGDYLFIASRLHPWKRIDLSVRAVLASERTDLRLLIAGTGEAADDLRRLAGNDPRIEFLGRISDEQLIELYAGCLAVPFTPIREDFGYATLEAFASGKPVVTVTDSGEPGRLVLHGVNGLISAPEPEALARAFEALFDDRGRAAAMGQAGLAVSRRFNWTETITTLRDYALGKRRVTLGEYETTRILVTDMQPITPAVGGGRLRLLGLYHRTGENSRCTYVGTYDWPGEPARDNQITDQLREITVPLTAAHHEQAAAQSREVGGKNVIDLLFSRTAHLSPDFIAKVREEIVHSDVVVFSHPWVYPLVKDALRPFQTVIYDSHNVESYLRAQLFDLDDPGQRAVIQSVIEDELAVCQGADWIFACSHEDMTRFHRLYDVPFEKMRIVPNGVMAYDPAWALDVSKAAFRAELGWPDQQTGIFIGSEYGPNIDAARFINEVLAPANPRVRFVIAGGVSDTIAKAGPNVVLTGRIDDADKARMLRACDFAINPMLSGSGTNIKMFDFMAAGLPIVTTETGARGIDDPMHRFMLVCDANAAAFSEAMFQLLDPSRAAAMGKAAREVVEREFAWENISHQVGEFCKARKRMGRRDRPTFSVIVPTYERPQQLAALMARLSQQIERDFEVVVVDQSETAWAQRDTAHGFPMTYYHSRVRGAVPARNTGAFLAQGDILAFVDDDCLPDERWLLNARRYFADPEVVGVEGRIESDHLNDPDWRPVTNVGFEGLGFMTANLLVRSGVFQEVGGFDLRFDQPHFREDTDLGWRLLEIGKIPHADDVKVFHPAQPRSKERESLEARSRFFEKDALLYLRHPERYRELFLSEAQWTHNPLFGPNLLRGFDALGFRPEDLPEWIRENLKG